jgi:hypothetical protein
MSLYVSNLLSKQRIGSHWIIQLFAVSYEVAISL